MAAEFFSLMTESSIPDNIREALASYDTPLFARSCNDQEELASLISHLMEASDTSSVGDQILASADFRKRVLAMAGRCCSSLTSMFSSCMSQKRLLHGIEWWKSRPPGEDAPP